MNRRLQGFTDRPSSVAIVAGCMVVVAVVSVHDATLLILNQQVIVESERNPIGLLLIDLNGGDVSLFVAIKLAGTTTVCTVIAVLFSRRPRMSVAIACCLAGIQLALLAYLSV